MWRDSRCRGGRQSLPQQTDVGHRTEGGRWEPHILSLFSGFYFPPVTVPCLMEPALLPGSHAAGSYLHFSSLGVRPERPHSLQRPACATITHVLSQLLAGGLNLAPDASCPHTLPGLEPAAFSKLSHDILAGAPPQHLTPTPAFQLNTAAFQNGVLRATACQPWKWSQDSSVYPMYRWGN